MFLESPEKCWHGEFGRAVAPAGDVDADGFSDVVVTSHCLDAYGNGTGKTFVFYGSASGIDPSRYDKIEYPETFVDDPPPDMNNRYAGSAGDVDSDGYSDIVLGAFWQDAAYIYLGSPSGVQVSSPLVITGYEDQEGDRFGFSVASLGDVDADGFADVLVGRPNEFHMSSSVEKGFMFHGAAWGLNNGPTILTPTHTARFPWKSMFWSVASPGDLDGDGTMDIAAGGPMASRGDVPGGSVFIFLMTASAAAREPTLVLGWPDVGIEFPLFGCSLATGNYN
jgi:hypothetical protein